MEDDEREGVGVDDQVGRVGGQGGLVGDQGGRVGDQAGRPAVGIGHPMPLLESLFSDHLDPGYRAAADRRAAGPLTPTMSPGSSGRWRRWSYLIAGLAVVGLVLGVAAASTKSRAAGTDQARAALLQDIDNAQFKQGQLGAEQSSLAGQIRSAQSSLGAGGPLQTVQALEVQGGLTALTGPGLTVVIDGSTANSGAGVILDRDIRLLVNGLWASGAEAIAVGGVRLGTTSSIRQAGGAILVDNRPVFWPISIQAIGDPSSLHVKLVDTVGFGRFQIFVSRYGIRFDLTAGTALTVPGGGAPVLQYASARPNPVTTSPTDRPTAPLPATPAVTDFPPSTSR